MHLITGYSGGRSVSNRGKEVLVCLCVEQYWWSGLLLSKKGHWHFTLKSFKCEEVPRMKPLQSPQVYGNKLSENNGIEACKKMIWWPLRHFYLYSFHSIFYASFLNCFLTIVNMFVRMEFWTCSGMKRTIRVFINHIALPCLNNGNVSEREKKRTSNDEEKRYRYYL